MCNNSHSRWWRTSPSYRSSSRVWTTMCSGFKVLLIQKTNAYQDVQKKIVAQSNKIKHFFFIFVKQATSVPNEKQREALFVSFSPLISRDNMILGRWKIMTNTNCSFKMSDLLFIHKPNSTVETWQIRLNEFSLCHLHKVQYMCRCIFPIKPSFEVRSSRVLQPHCCESLMCLSSPLIIMLIKISLIPLSPLHQILFMLFTAHMHAGFVMSFLHSAHLQECFSLGWIFLAVTVNNRVTSRFGGKGFGEGK